MHMDSMHPAKRHFPPLHLSKSDNLKRIHIVNCNSSTQLPTDVQFYQASQLSLRCLSWLIGSTLELALLGLTQHRLCRVQLLTTAF